MSDEARTIAEIGKRNEVTMRFKQNLTEAEDDRAALLAIVKRQQSDRSAMRADYMALLEICGVKSIGELRDGYMALKEREAALRLALGRLDEVAQMGVFYDEAHPFYADAMQQARKALAGGPTNG